MTPGRIKQLLVVAGFLGVLGALGSTPSQAAAPGAATRGEAQGVFQAFFTGGSAIRAHNHLAEGIPGVPIETTPDGARIYPGLDGLEYCEQGWHVVLLGLFDDPAFFGGNKELLDHLAAADIRFVLDGVPLEVERTATKRFSHPLPPFGEQAFAVGFGAFLPPGALSVGTHQLQTFIHDPVFGDFDFAVGFTVISC
jgi:hypothetical protein